MQSDAGAPKMGDEHNDEETKKAVVYSRGTFEYNSEHIKKFIVRTRERGLREITGPCPRCGHPLLKGLGPAPGNSRRKRLAFWQHTEPEPEVKSLTFDCGCGWVHRAGQQQASMEGCGASFNTTVTIPREDALVRA
jgi:hypothetical protein